MRFVLSLLLTAVLSFVAGLFLPWWSVAIVAFLVAALIPQRLGPAFLSALLGVVIIWAVHFTWIDVKNGSRLSQEIAELFQLGGSSALLIIVSALIGGLVAGFAAMAGSSLHPVKKKTRRY